MASTETRKIQFDFTARDQGVQKTVKETGDSIEGMNQGLEEGGGKFGKLGGMAAKLGPVLAGVGAAAALIAPAIAKGLDAQDASAKFRAQLGLTAKESGRIGGVAGKLYSDAYGESMDDVRGAITAVIRNMDGMRTASSKNLQDVTGRAMTLAKVMDEDVGPVTVAVSQMMRTGLAKNSKEAFDILTRGAQMGANKAEDLLDTFNEYSTQFRDLGLNGAQAMGIIQQGLEGGARDADLVADALKEMNIRVQDGTAAAALQKLGLNAKEMAAAFGKGGPSAAKAFDLITDKLRGAKTRTEQYTLAQQIFGTQSEDMSRALLKIDPSSATKKLGKFSRATKNAADAMGKTFSARVTKFKRTIETQVTNVATRALNVLSKFGGEIKKGFNLPKTGKAANDWQKVGVVLRNIANWVRTKLIPAIRDLGDWFTKKIAPEIKKFYKNVLGELISQVKKITSELKKTDFPFGKLLDILKKIYAFVAKYFLKIYGTELKYAFKIVGWWIQFQIKVYGLLWKQLVKTWDAVKVGIKRSKEFLKAAKDGFDGARKTTQNAMLSMTKAIVGWAATAIKSAAKAFGWVPGLGGKLKKAAKEMEGFQKRTNDAIARITKSKKVKVIVSADGSWAAHGVGGGTQKAYAKGGRVWSDDPKASQARDSVPAMLRLNEHVWTPEEVQDVGGHAAMYRLRAAARKGLLKGYAAGGAVTPGLTGVDIDKPNMAPIWKKIEAGERAMILKLAAVLAKMGGSTGVVRAARSMIGYPYSWGGGGIGGPSYGIGRGAGTFGFDCSGLTQYAWWKGAHRDIGGVTNPQWANSRQISGPRPGALGFPSGPSVHVMLASDRPGYVIQAPYTGSYVQEVRRSAPMWRWPKGAGFYSGGPVGQAAAAAFGGAAWQQRFAQALGLVGDPGRRRAAGGPVTANRPYIVGERGPEVFTPRAVGTVHSSGTKVVTVHQKIQVDVHVPATVDKGQVGREINEALKEYKRRGGRLVTAGGNG